MTGTEWLVMLGAAAAIGWVNWYFLAARRPPRLTAAGGAASDAAKAAAGSPQQATVIVDGGYSPSTIRVRAGQPVRLVFDRRDTSGCSEEVVFPDFGIRRYLPTGRRTTIELTPPTPGTYEFMCGMSMLRGALIAES